MKSALKKFLLEGGELSDSLARFLYRQRMMVSSTGQTPAALMLGRVLRSKLDLIREPPTEHPVENTTRKFAVGEPVIVRDYRSAKPKWIPGRVTRHRGSVICDVSVPQGTWKRHYNQIRRRSENQLEP